MRASAQAERKQHDAGGSKKYDANRDILAPSAGKEIDACSGESEKGRDKVKSSEHDQQPRGPAMAAKSNWMGPRQQDRPKPDTPPFCPPPKITELLQLEHDG